MRVNRRYALSLLAGSAAAAGLAACGSKKAQPHETQTTTATPTPSATPSWSNVKNSGGGQLSLLSSLFTDQNSQQRYANDVLIGFFGGSAYSFTTDYTTPERLLDTIYTGLVGADLSDLVMPGVGWVESLQRRNVLREIPEDVLDDLQLDDRLLTGCRYQGSLRAVPYVKDLSLVAYRADLFTAAGIADPPATLDEVRAMAKQLTTPDVQGFDPFGGSGLVSTWITLLGAYGGTLFTDDGKPRFDQGQGTQALDFIIGLVKDGSTDPSKIPASGASQLFVAKKAAMTLLGTGMWDSLGAAGLADTAHLGLIPMPPSQQGKDPCMLQSGTLLAVSNQSSHPEVAFEFCHYALGKDPLQAVLGVQPGVPARSDVVSGSALQNNRILTTALTNVQYATITLGGSPAWLDLVPVIESELMAAITGRQSSETSISNLARVVTDSIAHN